MKFVSKLYDDVTKLTVFDYFPLYFCNVIFVLPASNSHRMKLSNQQFKTNSIMKVRNFSLFTSS